MKKLFGKIVKHPRVAKSVAETDFLGAEFPTTPTAPPSKRIELEVGLHELTAEAPTNPALTTNAGSQAQYYPIDIIAIHGLNGHPFYTWTHKNGTLWLKDLLLVHLLGCRVYTYGYPSQVFSTSFMEGKEYARALLEWI